MSADRPLAGVRVVDLVEGPLAPITRYLAELGARVDRFVPRTGDARDFVANAGKIWHDGPVDAATMGAAHIIVASPAVALDQDALAAASPALVLMQVSPFGSGNGFSDWKASDAVLHALSGSLSRSGIRGRPPLLPPGELAWQCAAVQGAYVLLAAYYKALRSGIGDRIDFAALDGAMQALDPGYGINGSATMGRPVHLLSRDRPAKGTQYPIFPCADGEVRICLLAPRQWQGMFRWMGEPEAFAGPEFARIITRQESTALQEALAAFFATRSRAELETQGQAHGVPIAGLLNFQEFAASDQVVARNALTDLVAADGTRTPIPNGVLTIDGARMGPVDTATDVPAPPAPGNEATAHAFDGLKVLDLGVIVVGAEAGRMFADGGADVVKIESAAFPDGSRQSYLPYGLSASFAAGHRNKRSLGLDLRQAEGRALFLDLVGQADVLLSNFKPGTMESLGLGPDVLASANPRLVMADSSAFGPTGPWAKRLGYGPLVRAATGLTQMWRYPGDPDSYSDAVTVYPDHVAGRISAIGAIALLIRRLRTGRGGTASVSQAETMLAQFADLLLPPDTETPPHISMVLPAQGDDEWCVVTLDRDGTRPEEWLDGVSLEQWVGARSPMEAATALQARGIAAAPMLRVADLPDFAYCRERDSFRIDRHPHLPEPVVSERAPAHGRNLVPPQARPAPLMGEQTAQVVEAWLGLGDAKIGALEEVGILQPTSRDTFTAIEGVLAQAAP